MTKVCAKDLSCLRGITCLIGLLLLLLIGTPGYSQVNYQAEENHEQKLKQSLKDAAKVDAVTYKDTHLNTSAYTYKKGVRPQAPSQRRTRTVSI
ncbi:hypothetical protein GCM10028895_37090 [Pontibacter rugosus]